MTTEEKLKELILDRYNSIREFTLIVEIPYSTLDSIFRRGINNSSVGNIVRICKALRISADELAEGRIVSTDTHAALNPGAQDRAELIEINDIIADTREHLLHSGKLTWDGESVDPDTITAIVQGMEVSLEVVKKHNQIHNQMHNQIQQKQAIDANADETEKI